MVTNEPPSSIPGILNISTNPTELPAYEAKPSAPPRSKASFDDHGCHKNESNRQGFVHVVQEKPLPPQDSAQLAHSQKFAESSVLSPSKYLVHPAHLGGSSTGIPLHKLSPQRAALRTKRRLQMNSVGEFSDFSSFIHAVSAEKVTSLTEACRRLLCLKRKLNELQNKRDQYHENIKKRETPQSVPGTIPNSIIAFSFSYAFQSKNYNRICTVMQKVILQINKLRSEYSEYSEWVYAESKVRITPTVFVEGFPNQIYRNELIGQL